MLIKTKAFARAGLLGNPSDGFGGKTISFSMGQYFAEIEIEPHESVQIFQKSASLEEQTAAQLVESIKKNGYYGANRLIKASIKKFAEFFPDQLAQGFFNRGFKIGWQSSIPRAVGLAGSSAIIVATLRALEVFFELKVPQDVLPSLALAVEVDELGIPAGLQDRVIQCLQGLVHMDFSDTATTLRKELKCGEYQQIASADLFGQLYVSFGEEAGQPTEVLHNNLRQKFERGDREIVDAMKTFAELAEQGKQAVVDHDFDKLGKLIDANFDLRDSIAKLHELHREMIQTARACGASAKYCGSGGAIVGICTEKNFCDLVDQMNSIRCHVIRPEYVSPF